MKLKYTWYLASKSVLNKKSNIFIIILLLISILLIVLSFSFVKTLDNYLTDGIMKDINYRTFFVDKNVDSETEDVIIEKMKKINHVVDVFPSRYKWYSVNLEKLGNKDMKGSFFLIGSNDMTLPKISTGREIRDENEIICPKLYYPDDDLESKPFLKNKDFLQMEKYINQSVIIKYYVFIDSENLETRTKELKVVGTYNNNPSYIDENTCYASRSLVTNIFNDSYQNIDMSNQIDSLIIQIDNIENGQKVVDSVTKQGYYINPAVDIDYKFINLTKYISYFILIITTIISILVIIYLNQKEIISKRKEINVYRSLGYNKKEVSNIIIAENMNLGIFSAISSFILILITWFIFKLLIYYNPLIFQKIPVTLDIFSILISIIVTWGTLLITTYYYKNKILSSDIISNIRE